MSTRITSILLLMLVGISRPALGQTVYDWDGDVDSDWQTANNWRFEVGGANPPAPPDTTIRAEVSTSAGNTPEVGAGDAAQAGEVRIGRNDGAGLLTISGGSLNITANRFRVGAADPLGNAGTLIMTGGTLTTAFSFVTGSSSHGQITMSGGSIAVTGSGQDFNMDENQAGAASNLTMSGGSITVADVFLVDQFATVNLSGGSIMSIGDVRVRRDAVVSLTGGLIETSDGLELGSGATPGGTIELDGGIVRALRLDAVPGATGVIEINALGLLQFRNSEESVAEVQSFISSGYITTAGLGLQVTVVDVGGIAFTQVNAVPESGSAVLLGMGMCAFAARRKRFG